MAVRCLVRMRSLGPCFLNRPRTSSVVEKVLCSHHLSRNDFWRILFGSRRLIRMFFFDAETSIFPESLPFLSFPSLSASRLPTLHTLYHNDFTPPPQPHHNTLPFSHTAQQQGLLRNTLKTRHLQKPKEGRKLWLPIPTTSSMRKTLSPHPFNFTHRTMPFSRSG